MGLLMYLYIVGNCFDFLAWPFFALVYPLCASIKAIELNSNPDIKKLTTYWVVFSLISIFDLAITKILPWIPFWPYFKLMVICWLVLPYFDGALYVYGRLVRLCLPVFTSPNDEPVNVKKVDLQVSADSCVKFPKQSILDDSVGEPNVDAEMIKTSEDSQKNRALKSSTDQPVLGAYQGQQRGAEKEPGSRTLIVRDPFPEQPPLQVQMDPPPRDLQREWSCGLCQVTTQSEVTLQSHLKGMRHKTNVDAQSARMMALHNPKGRHQYKESKINGKIWCDKCEIWCSGAVNMISHLTGKKHVERLRELAGVGNSETASLS